MKTKELETEQKNENKKEEKKKDVVKEATPKRKPFTKEDKTAGFWRTLFPYMKPFKRNILVAIVFSMITGACVALQPLVIKYVVDSGISGKPFILFGKNIPIGDPLTFIAILAGAYVLVSLGRIYSWRYGYKNILKMQEGTLFNLRSTFFGHVQRMCMHFRDKNSSGEL